MFIYSSKSSDFYNKPSQEQKNNIRLESFHQKLAEITNEFSCVLYLADNNYLKYLNLNGEGAKIHNKRLENLAEKIKDIVKEWKELRKDKGSRKKRIEILDFTSMVLINTINCLSKELQKETEISKVVQIGGSVYNSSYEEVTESLLSEMKEGRNLTLRGFRYYLTWSLLDEELDKGIKNIVEKIEEDLTSSKNRDSLDIVIRKIKERKILLGLRRIKREIILGTLNNLLDINDILLLMLQGEEDNS